MTKRNLKGTVKGLQGYIENLVDWSVYKSELALKQLRDW